MSFTHKRNSLFAFFGFSLFLQLFVLLSDLVELLHVFMKLWMFSECNEQLCLLAFSSVALNSDCFGLNFFKSSIFIPKGLREVRYLTRFSAAITLVETALPRAWSSISSLVVCSRYFFPRKTQKLGFFLVETFIWLLSEAGF